MNKKIYISAVCALAISASATDLGTIEVTEVLDTKIIENVSKDEVKSADLAETLHKQVPSINMIRRSGIANDITLRGQKRDNITVTIDDGKVCGACPNRMDPPTSHVVTANIDSIKVSEGPFDVENFGSLSGSVKIKTKKPTKDLAGSVETTLGSYGYKKLGASVSGGTDKFKLLLTGSYETSEQYKDGDGNTMAEQIQIATTGTPQAGTQFATKYKNMDAYTKKTFMAKTFIKVNDNQDLELSLTKNESDDVVYANSKMDALYDDSDIINFKYTLNNLSNFSKKLQFKAYNSKVEHPMSTKYRKSAGANSVNEVISKLTTEMTGIKVINDMQINDDMLTLGLDTSDRNWDGSYIGNGAKAGVTGRKSINDVDTKNNALFVKYDKDINNVNVKFGARYNDSTISTANAVYSDKDYNSFDANILATLKTNDSTKYFAGIGKASRVPDGRELYFNSSMNVMSGTPSLDQTTNTELDLGVEKTYENAYIKVKTFYSQLSNYIYFNKGNTKTTAAGTFSNNSFENIDATIYGLEINGAYDFNDNTYIDFGLSYQRGKKDEAMTSKNINATAGNAVTLKQQTDKDLADITPLKINLALNYDYDDTFNSKIELIHAQSWNNYDQDNGEQKLDGYNIVNLKAQKSLTNNLEMTVGVDNLFDKTYAVSNTYADLILLSDGTSGEVMLMNEPGRYIYANIKYTF